MTHFRKLRILVEGDSWHRLPTLSDNAKKAGIGIGGSNFDVSRGLSALGHEVKNIAKWSELITEFSLTTAYVEAIESWKPDVFVLCGGGNDLFDGQKLQKILGVYTPGKSPAGYVKNTPYNEALAPILKAYDRIFTRVAKAKHGSKLPIVCHTYDFPIPRARAPWLFRPMQTQGIFNDQNMPVGPDKELASKIVHVLLKRFHKKLVAVRNKHPNKANIRIERVFGAVGPSVSEWHDEIHPKKEGFQRVANKISDACLLMTEPQSDALIV